MDAAEADRLYGEARPAAERLGDPALLAWLSLADGVVRFYGGDAVGAHRSTAEAVRQADRTGEHGVRAFAWGTRAVALAFTGPLPDALRAAAHARTFCGDDPLTGTAEVGYSVHDAANLVQAVVGIPAGRLDESSRLARVALALFEQRAMAIFHAWTLSLLADLADWTGETAQAAAADRAAAEALRLAREAGTIAMGVTALQGAGVAAFSHGLCRHRRHRPRPNSIFRHEWDGFTRRGSASLAPRSE